MKKTLLGFNPTAMEDGDMEAAKLATGWTCSALVRVLVERHLKTLVLEILAKRENAAVDFEKAHKKRQL